MSVKRNTKKKAIPRARRTASAKTPARKGRARAAAASAWILPGHIPPELSHPKLKKLAQRMASGFEVAVEKVVANLQDPARYPLPRDSKALEHRLRALVEKLPAAKRRELAKQVMPRVEAGAAGRERRYGDLAKIDLRSKQSVVEQLKALALPADLTLTQVDATSLKDRIQKAVDKLKDFTPPLQERERNTLLARVLEVRCVKTADVRKDKITLTGLAVNNLGGVRGFGPIKVGEFKDGEAVPFPGPDHLQVATFDITQGDEFPKEFSVFFTLIEGNQATVDAIVAIIGYIADAGAILAVHAGLVAEILGAGLLATVLVLIGVGLAVVFIAAFAYLELRRDSFDDASVSQLFEGLTRARAAGSSDTDPGTRRTLTFEFRGGKYEMDVNFALVAG